MKKMLINFFSILIILGISTITTVDRTHVHETAYYQKTISDLENIRSIKTGGNGLYFKTGWAKTNMTPSYPVPLSGYGSRKGALSTGVHDSLWVRGFVFDNGITKSALITLDALLVPPAVTIELKDRVEKIGYSINNIFLSATHTHCSVGSWADSWIGNKFAGDFDPNVIDYLTDTIIKTIQMAELNIEKAQIGFNKYDANEFVTNRLVGEKGIIDPWLRVVKLQKESGEIAFITTFAAHATCLSGDEMRFSRDYPGALVDSLESLPNVDFAAFCAGGVGSHRPESGGNGQYDRIAWLASNLKNMIKEDYLDITVKTESNIKTIQFNFSLRDPHWRIGTNWRFRPWVFNLLSEQSPQYISILKIGNIVFAGTPCDFSGELIPEIESVTDPLGIHFIATSFNGGYIGYITKDIWYDLHEYETFIMNWFGPYNGAYFVELIQRLILTIS